MKKVRGAAKPLSESEDSSEEEDTDSDASTVVSTVEDEVLASPKVV